MKWNSIGAVLSTLFFVTVLHAAPVINSFDSYITVRHDGSLLVQEKINITTDTQSIRHGIYRDFPTRYQSPNGPVEIEFQMHSAEIDSQPTPYHLRQMSNGIRIYLGDKNYLLPQGTYTYTLTYSVLGELGYFKDHDELYWNVTGNGWNFPISQAHATVKLPQGAFSQLTDYTAYTGYQGSKAQDYQAVLDNDQQVIQFATTQDLVPHQGLTIVVGWKKGFVTKVGFLKRPHNLLLSILFAGLIIIFIFYFLAWRKYGVDGAPLVVIPEYEPPKGLQAAAIRFILNNGYDNKVLATALIELAVKGYLKIEENKKFWSHTFKVIKQKEFNGSLNEEEKVLVKELFSGSDSVELKYSSEFESAKKDFSDQLKSQYQGKYFVLNTIYFALGAGITAFVLIISALMNSNLWIVNFTLLIIFILMLSLKQMDVSSFQGKLAAVIAWSVVFTVLISITVNVGAPVFGSKNGIFCSLIVLIASTNLIFSYLLKRPTKLGKLLIKDAEGFKWFLNATERDRMNFRNPPEKTPELFEKYLPYALALGVEQHWAEQFTEILEKANYQPSWYVGRGIAFSGAMVASSLGSSFATAVSSSSSAPGTSSGFGGGGSSGGGGGGGGGGGW